MAGWRPVISDTVLIKGGEDCLIMHVETDRIKRRAETRLACFIIANNYT